MKDQWVGSNVDLGLLSERLQRFLVDCEFDVKLMEVDDGYALFASNRAFRLRVNVYGRPSDFTVEFIPSKKAQGFSRGMIMSYLMALFGGGSFLIYDVKMQEAVNKLERIFWKEVDQDVAELSDRAVAAK